MAAQAEPIHDIAHLGSVELFTPKPEKSLWYFRDLLGMEPVHRVRPVGLSARLRRLRHLDAQADRGRQCRRRLRLLARHQPAGAGAPRQGARAMPAWASAGATAISAAAARTASAIPTATSWKSITRSRNSSRRRSLHSTLKNLPQKYTGRGVGVRRVDHLALLAKDVEANRKFAQELLGFQLREQVRYDHGKTEIGSWMSPTAIHHQLAYVVDVKGAHGRLHHFSLWVDNRDDVLRAADILTRERHLHRSRPVQAQQLAGLLSLHLRAGRQPRRDLHRQLPGRGARLGAGDLERGGARHRHLFDARVIIAANVRRFETSANSAYTAECVSTAYASASLCTC